MLFLAGLFEITLKQWKNGRSGTWTMIMVVVLVKGPGRNKDDTTGACYTGKAENPKENPAKVLAVILFFCLFGFFVKL